MSFRYLIITCDGTVTGTNDLDSLPDVADSDTAMVTVDTQASTYSNDDELDAVISEYEPEEDSGDDGDDD